MAEASEAGTLKAFLGRFDMEMAPTPENVRAVTEQIQVIGEMQAAMESVTLVERGKRFIWLKANMQHGEWAEHIKKHFSGIPVRSIQRWMAEARYYSEHGQKRQLAHLNAPGMAHFDDDDGEGFSADDLADPSVPAPLPRKDLENEVIRQEKRLEAHAKREEKLLESIQSLERRLAAERANKDPDEAVGSAPIKMAMAKSALCLSRVVGLLDEADANAMPIEADCPARVFTSFASRLVSNVEVIKDRAYKMTRDVIAAAQEKKKKQ